MTRLFSEELRFIARSAIELVQGVVRRPAGRAFSFAACAWLALVLAQQLALLLLAWLVTALLAGGQVPNPGFTDDIYWDLAVGMVASARPVGLSLRIPFGVAFSPGASVVGVQLLQLIVNGAAIVAGVALLLLSYARPRRRAVRRVMHSPKARTVGVLAIAIGLASQLTLPWGSGGGEMALSMAATKILRIDSQAYEAGLHWEPAISTGINLLVAVAAAAFGAGISLVVMRFGRGRTTMARLQHAVGHSASWRAAAWLSLLVVALLPLQGRAVLQDSQAPVRLAAAAAPATTDALDASAAAAPSVDAAADTDSTADQPSGPGTIVTIVSQGGKFEYRVNGHRDFIRGIGYNPVTAGKTMAQRAARYDRDFETMASLGVNTVVGWDESEFDDPLMDAAAAHRIGVILPFDLRRNSNYENPDVRQRLLASIGERVMRFKDHPALRMWGLGNEVLHDMVALRYRSALQPAFASFEIEAADLIHRMDPNHPVVYRDAEDVYIRPIANALQASNVPRPWFVYGMNFFTNRLDDALSKGATRSLNQPLLISEFGPVGVRPSDRPAGYAKLWNIIRAHSDALLGGCAYVWSTAGPEPLDRTFGLTNDAGVPVDGSASALASLYISDEIKQAVASAKA